MSLQELMRTGLPLNRKERFYTGTIFPMLVCQDGFRYFDSFTSLIDGYTQQPIDVSPSNVNIQFFTEYGLAESIFGSSTERFPNSLLKRDTPDIIMLIRGTHTTLIAIEAKMFLAPAPTSLYRQMSDQKILLQYLKDTLLIDFVYHVALLPEQWLPALGTFEFPIITWQNLYKQFAAIMPNDYFLEVLRIALDTYEDLVSRTSGQKNNERKMTGLAIYEGFKNGTLMMSIMGRNGGLIGKRIIQDIASGSWAMQPYETNSAITLPNNNWFYIQDFVDRIDALENKTLSEIS